MDLLCGQGEAVGGLSSTTWPFFHVQGPNSTPSRQAFDTVLIWPRFEATGRRGLDLGLVRSRLYRLLQPYFESYDFQCDSLVLAWTHWNTHRPGQMVRG